MKKKIRMRCRSSDGHRIAAKTRDADLLFLDDAEDPFGELVASYPGDEYAVHIDADGTIYVYEPLVDARAGQTHDQAKSHSQRLKEIAEKYRKHVWW